MEDLIQDDFDYDEYEDDGSELDPTGRLDLAVAKGIGFLVNQFCSDDLRQAHFVAQPLLNALLIKTLGPETDIGQRASDFVDEVREFSKAAQR